MTSIPSETLNALVAAATNSRIISGATTKPCIIQLPNNGPVRIYSWTVTPDDSTRGRPIGEHKCQMTVPGKQKGARIELEMDDTPTIIVSYSPLYGVYALWESRYHQNSGYSKNLQISELILEEAHHEGWAVAMPRRLASGIEVRLSVQPNHLSRLLNCSIEADRMSLTGQERYEFMSNKAPSIIRINESALIPTEEKPSLIEQERRRQEYTRKQLERDRKFARIILEDYGNKCAICEVQLNILDAAHIIPVHDPCSTDERWNGMALCKNHHRLYDNRLLLIDGNLAVHINSGAIEALSNTKLDGGANTLLQPYAAFQIANPPSYYPSTTSLSERFQMALDYTFRQNHTI